MAIEAASMKNRFSIKINLKEDAVTLLVMIVVCFVQGVAVNLFYVTQGFLSGGVTGISLLLNYTAGLPSWLMIIILNVPVALVGAIFLDLKVALFSMAGTLLLSGAIALTGFIHIEPIDPILSAIVGGAIVGISGSPVVRRGATLGGMDVIAMILSKRYSIAMGTFNVIFNLLIMSLLGVFKGLELAVLSMLAMFVCNTAFNAALMGLNRTHTVFIISDDWEKIAPHIMKQMNRGVTYLSAEGAYTGKQRKLMYCIVKTVELSHLKQIVLSEDPKALLSIIDTKAVIGRGFGAVN